MKINVSFLLVLSAFFVGFSPKTKFKQVEQWGVFEIEINGPSNGNPYMDVELNAVFTSGKAAVKVPGFYDGNGLYRIRFSPPVQGKWSYQTNSNIAELSKQKGNFECVAPTGNNHGPVKTVNTFYLQYADGTPFYSVGTTAYQWPSVKQTIQEKTLQTLAEAPFNKIRMCVFPKSYIYGNETEPWAYPYQRDGETNDFTQPNFEFFQNFDKRVSQLCEMGIHADVILFHPYDKWGYCQMGNEMNFKYVRYMIARLSAYRNVWWSLANEWDIPEIKESIDWEGIGTILQKEDLHQRLRGIHNWYDTEDHFFDHSRPWITHVSAQTARFWQGINWRNQYQKPLMFDEMRYEGDVPSGWGNLKAEEMASYFWMAGLSGGYGTHGDTFKNDSDEGNEVRWWAKGGTLMGQSQERIRFFRNIMEQAPVHEMTPQLIDNGKPEDINSNIYLFSKENEYILAYTAKAGQTIVLPLPADIEFSLDIIDTWNMKIVGQKSISTSGTFEFVTEMPYTALRLVRKLAP
jgi:hypothetical protein